LFFPYLFGGTQASFYSNPYFGKWNLTELTGYVGSAAIIIATLAFLIKKKDYRILFWVSVAAVSLLLVLGDKTPLAFLMYKIPPYSLFHGIFWNSLYPLVF